MSKSKRKDSGRSRVLTWVIRMLIIAIFLVSVGITISRLTEWHRKNQEKERLEDMIEEAEQNKK